MSVAIVCTEFHNNIITLPPIRMLLLSSVFASCMFVCVLCAVASMEFTTQYLLNAVYGRVTETVIYMNSGSTLTHTRTHVATHMYSLKHRTVYGRIGLVFSLSITCLAFYRHFHLIILVDRFHLFGCSFMWLHVMHACVRAYVHVDVCTLCYPFHSLSMALSHGAEFICAGLFVFFQSHTVGNTEYLASGRT